MEGTEPVRGMGANLLPVQFVKVKEATILVECFISSRAAPIDNVVVENMLSCILSYHYHI